MAQKGTSSTASLPPDPLLDPRYSHHHLAVAPDHKPTSSSSSSLPLPRPAPSSRPSRRSRFRPLFSLLRRLLCAHSSPSSSPATPQPSQLTMPSLTKGSHSPTQPSVNSRFFNDTFVWKDAPLLKGVTKFEPLHDVRNIMITGGAGFIASWVVRHLTVTYPEAYNIVCFDKLDYCASLANIRMLNDRQNFTFYYGDITNHADVANCLQEHNIDTIIHFAAMSHVDLSFGNSFDFTTVNVLGTHVMLECAKSAGVSRFIHVSTDEVYGEVEEDGDDLIENSILAPTNPYAASKAAAEMLVNAYWKSFKLPVLIVRSNNVYGPHQYPEKVIPKFSCLLNRGQKLMLHGDGKHTRRYLYAGDAADAFDTILHKGSIGQIYNIGSIDEVSNLDLCAKLGGLFNLPHASTEEIYRYVQHTQDRPFNDRRYAVDGSKLKQLGWNQKTAFADGLQATVDWYKKYGETWWGDISNVFHPFPLAPANSHSLSNGNSNGNGYSHANGGVDGMKGVHMHENNAVQPPSMPAHGATSFV